jgi:hypothetical protein
VTETTSDPPPCASNPGAPRAAAQNRKDFENYRTRSFTGIVDRRRRKWESFSRRPKGIADTTDAADETDTIRIGGVARRGLVYFSFARCGTSFASGTFVCPSHEKWTSPLPDHGRPLTRRGQVHFPAAARLLLGHAPCRKIDQTPVLESSTVRFISCRCRRLAAWDWGAGEVLTGRLWHRGRANYRQAALAGPVHPAVIRRDLSAPRHADVLQRGDPFGTGA